MKDVIFKYATLQLAVYPMQPGAPNHRDLSDVSTIKSLFHYTSPVTVLMPKSPLLMVLSLVKLTSDQ